MEKRAQGESFWHWRPVRLTMLAIGILLILATPVVGVLPGPGGIFVFGAGLALVLRNSEWAKRRYVRFKRQQPKAGAWADWGLRRPSAKRREELRKAKEREEQPPAHGVERMDDPLPHAGFEAAPVDPTPGELRPPLIEERGPQGSTGAN